ncbi:MAG: ABC-F family ATP-binding cassette domain-containing protein [Flavobacteriales bacterium]|nr:ABC-F family ATP-binding cassette domain-containing protein [Flavobacteriales bacterium]MDW8431838.1 ABC-F family ATP-binding cassette domain-containing protein [Flavobacteriales bacterium]
MALCTLKNLGAYAGGRWLFRHLDLGLTQGDRVGLVARNGRGKSTLLAILSGIRAPDEGEFTLRSGIQRVFLPQQPAFDLDMPALEAAFSFLPETGPLLKAYHKALRTHDTPSLERLAQEVEWAGAWNQEIRLLEFLDKLEISDPNVPMHQLSGGQQRRVCLAGTLASGADLWLLDEPTNHLDIDLMAWLEEALVAQTSPAMLIVSHDRQFLDSVCTSFLEIDQERGYYYAGNYDYFLEKRRERIENAEATARRVENIVRRESAWAATQPRARGTKSQARLNKLETLKESLPGPADASQLQIKTLSERLGTKTLELHNISFRAGEKVLLSRFSYNFKPGEKVMLTGKNGSGKSTFLRILIGELTPATGKVVTGETTRIGYFAQSGIKFEKDQPILDFIRDIAEGVYYTQKEYLSAAELLRRFDFPPARHMEYISRLSGGEKKRLYLLSVLIRKPNVLILDEPGNDLDIPTLEKLEEYLLHFPGTLIMVTHDRRMMERLADTTFLFRGKGVVEVFPGAYIKEKNSPTLPSSPGKEARISKSEERREPVRKKLGLSYKEQKELAQLEKEIPELEAVLHQMNLQLTEGGLPFQELNATLARLEALSRSVEEKTRRWFELEEKRNADAASKQLQ